MTGFPRRFLLGSLACAVSCAVSIAAVDRPVAVVVHAAIRQPGTATGRFITALGATPDLHIALAFLLVLVFALASLWGRQHWKAALLAARPLYLVALAVVLTNPIRSILKHSFGRTWPETWTHDNPSFIRDGVYGFFPFQGGIAYSSFPSGHAAAVFAAMTVLWWLWPRWRVAYGVAALGAALGLVGMNYHFVSDVIAGAYLGWVVGEVVARLGGSPSGGRT